MGERIKKNSKSNTTKNQATLLQLGFTKIAIKNENQKDKQPYFNLVSQKWTSKMKIKRKPENQNNTFYKQSPVYKDSLIFPTLYKGKRVRMKY